MAAIGGHGVKPVAHPHFANLPLHLFAAAKLDPCGPLRFFWRHARAGVFLDQHFEVRANLLVQIAVATGKERRLRKKLRAFARSGMPDPFYEASKALAMAQEIFVSAG